MLWKTQWICCNIPLPVLSLLALVNNCSRRILSLQTWGFFHSQDLLERKTCQGIACGTRNFCRIITPEYFYISSNIVSDNTPFFQPISMFQNVRSIHVGGRCTWQMPNGILEHVIQPSPPKYCRLNDSIASSKGAESLSYFMHGSIIKRGYISQSWAPPISTPPRA